MLRPPVGGETRDRYGPLVSLCFGSTVGGLLLGLTLALLSQALAMQTVARGAVVLGLAGLATAPVLFPALAVILPERACQVQESFLRSKGREQAAWAWGIELGVGFRTFIVTPGLYALFAVAIGQPHPLKAMLVCATYGAVRGMVIATFSIGLARPRIRKGETPLPGLGLASALRTPLLILGAAGATLAVM